MAPPRTRRAPACWLPVCAALASMHRPVPASADAAKAAPGPRALVYAQNPVRTPAPRLTTLALRPVGPYLGHPSLLAQSCVDQGKQVSLTTSQGARSLRVCTPVSSARPDDGGAYTAPPDPSAGPDAFAEAMLFQHAARTLDYLESLQLPWPAERAPLRLIANVRMPAAYLGVTEQAGAALWPWPEALFVPASREDAALFHAMLPERGDAIWFGQGASARFAYDGDVIVHEVVHALLSPLLPSRAWFVDEQGASAAHGAIDEALADYFAAVLNGDPMIGEYAARDAALWQQRSLEVAPRCPEALVGRAREDSLLLSSALWAVRKQLAPLAARQLDRVVIAALTALQGTRELSFERLLDTVAGKLGAAGAKTARRAWSRRGLLPACTRVLTLDPAQSLAGAADSFFSPGTGALQTRGIAPGVVQLRVLIPKDVRVVRLRLRAGGGPVAPLEQTARSPFRPLVLSKRGAPLRFGADGAHDAEHVHELAAGALSSTRIEVSGASVLYLQVANAGEQDGFYDDLAVAFER